MELHYESNTKLYKFHNNKAAYITTLHNLLDKTRDATLTTMYMCITSGCTGACYLLCY